MSNIIGNLAKAAAIIVAVPVVTLLAYDAVAVRPRLAQVNEILASAKPQDAAPPEMVRKLIDANAGSPAPYATMLVVNEIYPTASQGHSHLREMLWQFLLPMHVGEEKMYGLYATLAYNGKDHGLSNFAVREYGKALDQLSPIQAANAVAITHAPAIYLRDRNRLSQRAAVLLAKSGYAP